MQSKISTPVAIVLIVVVLALAGFFYWRATGPKATPTDAKGIPLVPPESRAEADKMHQMWQSGALRPPTTQPQGGPPGSPAGGPPPAPPATPAGQ